MNTTASRRAQAIWAAGAVLARRRQLLIERTPRESALAAYVPGGPSVEELEQRITDLLYPPTQQAA